MRSRTSGRTAASIVVSPATLSIVSGTFQLTALVKDQTGTVMAGTQPDAWHTSNAGVVTVNATGLVTFIAVGTANVTASLTTAGGTITSNTCVVTGTVGTNYVRSDFSSGSISPQFYDVFAQGRWTVIDDPTGSGRGKVAKVQYFTNGTTQVDDNQALLPTPPGFSIGLGAEVWFQGDVYIDPAARMDPSGANLVQRKLFRFGWDGTQPHPFEAELSSFGPAFLLVNYSRLDDVHYTDIDTGVAALTSGVWHQFRQQLRMNSTFAATDGISRIWYDNVMFFEQTNMSWTDPTQWSAGQESQFAFTEWGVGDQVSAGLAVNEYRLWDNISYAVFCLKKKINYERARAR